jgi:hypothetical protein
LCKFTKDGWNLVWRGLARSLQGWTIAYVDNEPRGVCTVPE